MYKIQKLIMADVKNIKRDSLLILTILAPMLLTIFLRFTIPYINILLYSRFKFNLSNYYNIIMGMSIMLIPMIVGCMAGFILLEDKDENMLDYFSITPLGKKGYILYRLCSPITISIIFSLMLFFFSNLLQISFVRVLFVIVVASLEGPIITLIMGSFAENRVEGIAISKVIGVFFLLPILIHLINFDYKWIFAVFPTYWIIEMINNGRGSGSIFLLYILVGLLTHIIYLLVLKKRFEYS